MPLIDFYSATKAAVEAFQPLALRVQSPDRVNARKHGPGNQGEPKSNTVAAA